MKQKLSPMRIPELDGIRFLAMTCVIGFHLGEIIWSKLLMLPHNWQELWRNWMMAGRSPVFLIIIFGDHGVPVFILLSGMGLQLTGVTDWRIWIKKRITKIIIPFWIALLGGSPLIWLAWRWAPEVVGRTMIREFSWIKVIISGLFLQNWSYYTWNSPASAWWFLPIILQLYIMYPFLRWAMKKLLTVKFLIIISIVQTIWNLSLLRLMSVTNKFWFYGWFSGLSYIALFGLGMVIGEMIKNQNLRVRNMSGIRWLMPGVLIWLGGLELRMISGRLMMFSEVFIGLGGWLTGLVIIRQLTYIIPKPTSIVIGIGRLYSYSIYLWHQPLLIFIWSLVKVLSF